MERSIHVTFVFLFLLDRAQSARPCILFFDEFDSLAPQ